ncbi:hypothetical protein [Thiomicrorhabdus sp. Milos-T2]|nr:hypothetical protein [Thiomicrorhabdus sp. Milos-T2]
MDNSQLEKKLSETWKHLLNASLKHNEELASSLLKDMIQLEIEQKKSRH